MAYPHKGTKLGVLEKLWYNLLFESDRVLDDKGFPILGPAGHCWIARVHHVIRL